MGIRIVTDSTSDIDVLEAAEKGISVGRLTVVIDGVEYVEGDTITYKDFFEKADNAKGPVLTSQPSPDSFLKIFNEAKEAGDYVIGLFVSQNLSGTFQSANIAARASEYDKIYLIDTNNISISVRLMVYKAYELIQSGMGFEELCKTMEDYKNRLDAYTIVGDLTYLKRSGRLSPGTAFVANLLNIKPVTTVNGKVDVVAKPRGKKGAIEKALDIIENTTTGIDKNEMCIVGYIGPETTWHKDLIIRLDERFGVAKNLKVYPIGASVGNHVGADSVAIAFFRNN